MLGSDSPHHTALKGTVDGFKTFSCVEPHGNMVKGVHLKFRSHFNSNRPIPPTTRSVAHTVTCNGGVIAETRTASGLSSVWPSSARLEPLGPAREALGQPSNGAQPVAQSGVQPRPPWCARSARWRVHAAAHRSCGRRRRTGPPRPAALTDERCCCLPRSRRRPAWPAARHPVPVSAARCAGPAARHAALRNAVRCSSGGTERPPPHQPHSASPTHAV